MTIRGGGNPVGLWSLSRGLEWARRPGASPPMRMTASWCRSAGIDRIQVCGARRAPDGELPSVVMFANTEPLGKICLNRGSPIREFGLVRPNKSAALLGTVKGKSLRDGLRPPLTVPAPSGPSQPVGTRRWSPAHQTRRWNDPRSALTLSAPYKSFDPDRTLTRRLSRVTSKPLDVHPSDRRRRVAPVAS